MLDLIFTWIVYIFLFFFFLSIVVFNVARLVYWIKCFKIEDCCKKSCRFKMFCYKYYEEYTKEDIERLRKMLAESGLPDTVVKKEDDEKQKE